MLTFKIIRKIGKMLRGGAGKKEIFIGALCGVLIGFNPVAGLTLSVAILLTLLLNANVGFTLLGVALGKLLSLMIAPISFHTGYFIIHKIGIEELFAKLANAPVTALMDLDVYAMIGSLPFSLLIGIAFGILMLTVVTKIREQMVKVEQHDKIGKFADNKWAKVLMWIVFGKQKVSTSDVLEKQSPLLRKSGLILVGSILVIGLFLNFLFLDIFLKKGIQSAISNETGAEVNIEKAHLSLLDGKLELKSLQVTDPDKPTHNLLQLDSLTTDISIGDLLRKTYTIDLLAGSTLQRDVLREQPGALYVKEQKAEKPTEEKPLDKTLETYFAQSKDWKKYGEKALEYLKQRKENAEVIAQGEKPKTSKKTALADTKKRGYLKATADLITDRPSWTIHQIKIDNVLLGGDLPAQQFQGLEISSHPELNKQPSTFALTPEGTTDPSVKIILHFDNPAARHELFVNMKNIEIGDSINAGDSLKIESGKADLSANGKFSTDTLDIPFTLLVRDLKTDNEMLNHLKHLKLPGTLYGTLTAPRVKVEIDDKLKDAVIDSAKEKAKAEAKKAANKEINKALESDEAKELKGKASDAFKKLF